MKYLFILLCGIIFFLSFLGLKKNDASDQNVKITEEQAIQIANKEMDRLGYDVKNMNIKVSQHDKPWNNYLPQDSVDEYDIIRKDKLKGKKYWAVYYYVDNPLQRGGGRLYFC